MTKKDNTQAGRQQEPQSDKYSQIGKRKKMLTKETKKVVGGIIVHGKHKGGEWPNHNEIFVYI